jgi:hypothetical protein
MPALVFKKWFPGHYIDNGVDAYDLTPKTKSILFGPDARLITGVFIYATWSIHETSYGVFNFDNIRKLLSQLPVGKKLALSLAWQAWGGKIASPVPADMVGKVGYDQGYRISSKGHPFATIHMKSTMDRYLRFVRAFAKEFDNDPRLAFVTTAEIPYEKELHVGQYTYTQHRDNLFRMATLFPAIFPKTPAGILGAWWPGPSIDRQKFVDLTLAAKGGFGFPDICVDTQENFLPSVVQNAGKWPCWMGIEWKDYLEVQCTGKNFPADQMAKSARMGSNFVWWLACNRTKEGGHSVDEAINYLRTHPNAGIQKTPPTGFAALAV